MTLGIEPTSHERGRTRDRPCLQRREDRRGLGRHGHHHRDSAHTRIVDVHDPGGEDDYRTTVAVFRKSKKARQAEVEELRAQVRDLTTQITALASSQSTTSSQLDELATRFGSLDARIVQVGSEVTHQLGELSGDIDALGRRADSLTDEITNLAALPQQIDGVRTDQVRLAQEQARYEIAFRQDLAEIAERLQRQRPGS